MTPTKICYKCKKQLSLDSFKRHSGRHDGLQPDCIQCQKEYRKQHYLKNKQVYKDRAYKHNKILREKNTAIIEEIKSKLSCIRCGENHIACLDFHHRNPEEKEFPISTKAQDATDWEVILKEIEKCDVLCANCHRKHHYEERKLKREAGT